MMRYVRLYLYFLRFAFSTALEFRVDFTFRIFMDLLYYAVQIGFYGIIYNATDLLAGWDRQETMLFVGGYLLADALHMTIFANNLWWLPYFINRGDLDYYLTRPVSSLFFLSLRDFAANSFVNMLGAVAIFIVMIVRYPEPLSAGNIALYTVLIFNGALILYMIQMLALIPIFWIQSPRGFQQMVWNVQRFMERPDRIFTGWVRRILVSVLPFCLVASFPARIVIEGFSVQVLVHILAVTMLLFLLIRWLWHRGLAAYSSASS